MRMPATTMGSPKGLPDKIIETGYNLGFNKGNFATAFDSREYFEQNIRPANKANFTGGIKANREKKNNATFIQYDKKQREEFEDKVQRYLQSMAKEEKEQREREKLQATMAADE